MDGSKSIFSFKQRTQKTVSEGTGSLSLEKLNKQTPRKRREHALSLNIAGHGAKTANNMYEHHWTPL